MTERGAARISRDGSQLSIGPSSMRFDGAALTIEIDERCAPIPRRLRGTIRLHPAALQDRSFDLDGAGLHRWTPFAPCARIEARFTEPHFVWSGAGYLDGNCGNEPLENGFSDWTWSRAGAAESTVVLYDVNSRAFGPRSLALQFTPRGDVRGLESPPASMLPTTGWGVSRQTRVDTGRGARVVKTLEDAPFYSRSLLATHLFGKPVAAIHESLNLNRFRTRWVQYLLPFRMPRIAD
jgi:carotenoid 1,2-hydratase